jgi:hypothetical protein
MKILGFVNFGNVVVNDNTLKYLPSESGFDLCPGGTAATPNRVAPEWLVLRHDVIKILLPTSVDVWVEMLADYSLIGGIHPQGGWMQLSDAKLFGSPWLTGNGRIRINADTMDFSWPALRVCGVKFRIAYQGAGCDATNYWALPMDVVLIG